MGIIITGIIVLAITVIFAVQHKKKANHKKMQQRGLAHLGQIKKIITYVQQHRGLMAAWLNGDTSVEEQLKVLKQNITQESALLAATLVYKNERWIAFTDHWQRLIHVKSTPAVSSSFEQHTMMVRNLTYLLEDVAEKSHLTADYLTEFANIGYIWRELILATENIGQSRAIGTGVAAQKFCSSVDKIRLNFLIQTMTEVTEQTLQQLSYFPEEKSLHTELVQKATEKMNELTRVIAIELVNTQKITIDNQQYFQLATDTMVTMNNIFEHQVKQLNTAL